MVCTASQCCSLLPSVSHFRELPLSVPLLQAHWVFVCKREGKKKGRTSSEKALHRNLISSERLENLFEVDKV